MIAKGCPKCDKQVPVACKACPCGHLFLPGRKVPKHLAAGDDMRRRTQRVRREKPNYYDILEYDKQVKEAKLRNSECDDDEKTTKTKRKRVKKESEEDDEANVVLTPEKQLLCSVVLAELNRKLQMVTWKPA